MSPHLEKRALKLALASLALVAGCGGGAPDDSVDRVAQRAVENRAFGIHCTSTYFGGWLSSLPDGWTICGGLSSRLDDEANHKFTYNLYQKKDYWEHLYDDADYSLETVDLFFAFTHGATTTTDALWAMYDDLEWAESSSMTLGNERRGTSVLATYSGYTIKVDSYTWNRWDSVFTGGLRMALGSHDAVYSGTAEHDVGDVFAQYLNAGYSFRGAWAAGFNLTAYNNQDVAVMATGTSTTDCTTRRDNMSWDNFSNSSYPRLTGSSINNWCIWMWDDI